MTAVQICNRALMAIGEAPNITSISTPDGSAHAQLAAVVYQDAVEEVTESRHWTFADKRVALEKVTLASATASASTDYITTVVAHGLEDDNPVTFALTTGTALPAPLEEDTVYYVVSAGTLNFKVAEEAGGDPINLTTAGTGAWVVYKESDRDGADFMYALPTDCLTERYVLPAGAPDDWPGMDGALLGTPYAGIGVVASSANGLNYTYGTPNFGTVRAIPAKRALNSADEQVIYTNLDDAELLYTRYVDDPTQWPPLFKTAVVWRIAADFAGAIKRDSKLADWCLQRSQMAISEAARVDASRNTPTEYKRYAWDR